CRRQRSSADLIPILQRVSPESAQALSPPRLADARIAQPREGGPVRRTSMTLRIGLVTDIHYGPDVDVRRGSAAVALLARFTARMREQFHPDLVVDLGDRINDVDVGTDRLGLRKVREMLEAAGTPIVYAWGNHDLISGPAADAGAVLGKKADYESLDAGGYHVVVLNSQDPTVEGIGGTLSSAQLDWLEQDLGRNSLPAVVLCHHPLDEQD